MIRLENYLKFSFTSFWVICTLEQFRVTRHKYLKKGVRNRESNPYFPSNSSFQLDILPLLRSYESLKAIIDCTYFRVGILGIKAIKGSWTQIPQTIDIDTTKVIQILQIHILNLLKSYSTAKANSKSSYTCFRAFGAL